MFNIRWNRDVMAPTPKGRKRITGVIITKGYSCANSCYCPYGHICKYRGKYKWHNFVVGVRRFIYNHFKINPPILISFTNQYTDLSGTITCPFKVDRNYTCTVCKYNGGYDENYKGFCACTERNGAIKNNAYIHHYDPYKTTCVFFEKNEWADKYDKKTGELIFNDK